MHTINPLVLLAFYWRHRSLISQLIRKEFFGRFQGTYLGIVWILLEPILMLTVYVIVFRFIFGRHWYSEGETTLEFAIILFTGLLVFNLFREVISSSPKLIVKNVNYVKKVVFPLEVLPLVSVLSSLYQLLINLTMLCVAYFVVHGYLNSQVLYVPFILIPYIFMVLGLSLFLASMGVFLRDISQFIGMLVMATFFLSAVFYPIDSIPEKYQILFYLNPVAFTVDQFRNVFVMGRPPEWKWLISYYFVSLGIAWLGLFWFQKTRKGFADVL